MSTFVYNCKSCLDTYKGILDTDGLRDVCGPGTVPNCTEEQITRGSAGGRRRRGTRRRATRRNRRRAHKSRRRH